MDIFLHIGKEDIVASVPAPLTSFRRFPKKTSFTAKAKRKKRHWSHQSYSYFWMNLPEKAHAAPSTIFFLTTQPPHGKRSHQPASLSEGLHSSGAERRRGSFGEAALSHQKGKRRGKKKKKDSSESAARVVSAEEPICAPEVSRSTVAPAGHWGAARTSR